MRRAQVLEDLPVEDRVDPSRRAPVTSAAIPARERVAALALAHLVQVDAASCVDLPQDLLRRSGSPAVVFRGRGAARPSSPSDVARLSPGGPRRPAGSSSRPGSSAPEGSSDAEHPHGLLLDVVLRQLDLPRGELEVEDPAPDERVDRAAPVERRRSRARDRRSRASSPSIVTTGCFADLDAVGRGGQRHRRERILGERGRDSARSPAPAASARAKSEHAGPPRRWVETAHDEPPGDGTATGRSSIENGRAARRLLRRLVPAKLKRLWRTAGHLLPRSCNSANGSRASARPIRRPAARTRCCPALEAILTELGARVERHPIAPGPHERARALGRAARALLDAPRHGAAVHPAALRRRRALRPRHLRREGPDRRAARARSRSCAPRASRASRGSASSARRRTAPARAPRSRCAAASDVARAS